MIDKALKHACLMCVRLTFERGQTKASRRHGRYVQESKDSLDDPVASANAPSTCFSISTLHNHKGARHF